jgi:hypothetical protein
MQPQEMSPGNDVVTIPAPVLTVVATSAGVAEERRAGRFRKKGRRRSPGMSIFWGISGASMLGAAGFVLLTLYQQYDNSVTELQRDLKHFNESCAGLMRKDDFTNKTKNQWDMILKLEKELNEKSERIVLLEHQLKSREEDDRELVREVQRLRERVAAVEGRQSALQPGTATHPER